MVTDRNAVSQKSSLFAARAKRVVLKTPKSSGAQDAFVVTQGEEGTPADEICQKVGITQAAHFNWKKKVCLGRLVHIVPVKLGTLRR